MIKKYVNYYNIKRIIFIEKMEHNILLQYMKEADVVLDTCNWVGGITSLEVLSTGTPIITMPTEQLDSRLTYIIYQYCQDKFVKNLNCTVYKINYIILGHHCLKSCLHF